MTPGSALDLSSLTDAPAGKYGRIIRRKGQFAYEKAPGKTVRLFGFNNIHTEVWYKIFGKAIPRGEFEKNAKELARAIRAQGYNYVRLHGIDLDIMRGSTRDLVFDPESMDRQLTMAGCDSRRELPYHKALLNGEMPLTIGGGIGQSRLSMLLLGKAHIGEVQASIWDKDTMEKCEKAGIILL